MSKAVWQLGPGFTIFYGPRPVARPAFPAGRFWCWGSLHGTPTACKIEKVWIAVVIPTACVPSDCHFFMTTCLAPALHAGFVRAPSAPGLILFAWHATCTVMACLRLPLPALPSRTFLRWKCERRGR